MVPYNNKDVIFLEIINYNLDCMLYLQRKFWCCSWWWRRVLVFHVS